MRRKDREVADPRLIIEILKECNTIRVAMNHEPYPYVVPVSFGVKEQGGKLSIYFHCAAEGRKLELIEKDPHVCFEGDIFLGYEETPGGITTRYKSVIGTGLCRLVSEPDEIFEALKLITEHCGAPDYPLDRCKSYEQLAIYRIDADSLTGKFNRPAGA